MTGRIFLYKSIVNILKCNANCPLSRQSYHHVKKLFRRFTSLIRGKKWFRKSSSYFLATLLTAKTLSGMGLVKTRKIFGAFKQIESSSVQFRLHKNLSGKRSRCLRTLKCEIITRTIPFLNLEFST